MAVTLSIMLSHTTMTAWSKRTVEIRVTSLKRNGFGTNGSLGFSSACHSLLEPLGASSFTCTLKPPTGKTTSSTPLPQVTVALKLLRKELGASFQLGKPAPLRAVVMVGASGTRSQRLGTFHWHVAGLWPLEYFGIFLSVAQYCALTLKNVFHMNFLVENINK